MKKYLLFDLDGTLTDPKLGICTCVQYALHHMGIDEPDLDKLEPFIGPPLLDSFKDFYYMDEAQAKEAVAKYRERFSVTGLFENEVYPGIPAMLKKLCEKGFHLAVASSKPTVFVERILEHFEMRQYFQVVVGSELDGRRSDKGEVIEEALKQLFGGGKVLKDQIYMIGDRNFDVIGAQSIGVESIGVAYGYGGVEELMDAGADYVVLTVKELEELLLRETHDDKPMKGGLAKTVLPVVGVFLFTLLHSVGSSLFRGLPFLDSGAEDAAVTSMWPSALGYVTAVLCLLPLILPIWREARPYMKLSHLRSNKSYTYVMAVAGAVGLIPALNYLLGYVNSHLPQNGYHEVAARQQSGSFASALILFCIVAPLAEEILFRGYCYNAWRMGLGRTPALLLSALLFGVYHGNLIQGLYGFAMGLFMAFVYDYFGYFFWPLLIHMMANWFAFLGSYTDTLERMPEAPWLYLWLLAAGIALIVWMILTRRSFYHVKRKK